MPDIQMGLIWYLAFLFSTVFHEFSHAFTAMKMGDSTAYESGQVSLSPIPHIKREPLGMVVVPVISFLVGGWMIGWGSAPYNYEWAYTYPKKSAAMSAAGPMSNFILLFITAVIIHIGIYSGLFYAPESITISSVVESYNPGVIESFAKILSVMFSLNLILFMFNLIPLPPLDGSGIIPMFLGEEKARKYMNFISNPAFSIIGILIAWRLFDLVYWKIHLAFINFLYFGSNYE